MFEEQENPPNEETQMVISPKESNQGNPENSQHEKQPEKEEENKKTVKEEKRPHESAEEDDDPGFPRKEKKVKESVDGEEVSENPRSVLLEPITLAPFLVRLEHDVNAQIGLFEGMIRFHEKNSVYPFESQEAMEDFINNWLQVRVPRHEFEQTLHRVWENYLATGISIGEKLDSLSPNDRQVFLLGNRILYAYYKEKKDRKRQVKETHGSTSSYDKAVKIGGSHMPQNKELEKSLKQYKEVDKKWEMVVARKLKMKQKMSEYQEEKEIKQSKTPEERTRENIPEKKPSEKPKAKASEKPEKKPSEDPDEAWSEANFEILDSILQSLQDYSFIMMKFPYDDAVDMDDFVKNWVRVDITASDCLEVIRTLKKNYKKKFWESIDHGLFFPNQIQELLYNSSEALWSSEAHLKSDDEEEKKEKEHSGDEEEVKNHVEGGGDLERECSNVQRRLDFSELEDDPATRSMLPFLVKSTYAQGLGFFSDLMPVSDPVPLAVIHPQIPPVPQFHITKKEDNSALVPLAKLHSRILPPIPRFHVTEKEDNSQHKVGSDEDSSLVNRTDPGGPNSQCDDPEKPHNENPDGGNEAPEEPNSNCEKLEDTKE